MRAPHTKTALGLSLLLLCSGTTQSRPYAALSGLAAAADSAVTAGTNPAGAVRFDEPAYQVELLAFFSESTWEGEFGDSGTGYESDSSGETFVPSGYMIRPINDDFTFSFTILGVGFSDDFGDWPGRYFIESYDSVSVSAFPSIAYRVNDRLSVAGSLTLTYSIFDQERVVANILDPGFSDGSAKLETDGFDVGFGLSMLYQVSDRFRWGLTYLSEQDPDNEGEVDFSGLGPNTERVLREAGFIGADVEVKSRTPQSVLGGVYYEWENRHALTVDVAWSDFSRFKLSEFYFDGSALGENEGDYEDIWAISASYSWPVANRWMVSVAGLYVDDMVEDDKRTMTLRLDSIWSIGAAVEWKWREDRALQVGLSYMTLGDAPVTTPDIPLVGSASGKFSSRDIVFLRFALSFGAL
jgi:long-chain fatty acid transport protein